MKDLVLEDVVDSLGTQTTSMMFMWMFMWIGILLIVVVCFIGIIIQTERIKKLLVSLWQPGNSIELLTEGLLRSDRETVYIKLPNGEEREFPLHNRRILTYLPADIKIVKGKLIGNIFHIIPELN